ncbi:MAG TPA: MFS transporter [Actinomycetota bacterium]|nr:MFS transporter [Actinomycetota bacterium]
MPPGLRTTSRNLSRRPGRKLSGWLQPSVLPPAGLAAGAGFGQFLATATLADVATGFSVSGAGDAALGLTDTTLGLGLSIIRMGSLAALPLAALADRAGRRRVITGCAIAGLALTAGAALSPAFWWFVLILALARPLLSATNAVALVVGAEVSAMEHRARAVSVIGAAYAVGAGVPVLLRAAFEGVGFRILFGLALLPLALIPFAAARLREPERYAALHREPPPATSRMRSRIPPGRRARLVLLGLLTAAAGFVSGPANTFAFYFAEEVRNLQPSAMALSVLAAGPVGLAGLLVGRWAADVLGRRVSAAVSLAGIGVAAFFTYNVGGAGVAIGYLLGMFAASVYTPASGALSAELFPTSCRSTAAGWLTVAGVLGAVGGLALFGFLADELGSFETAAASIAIPVILISLLYAALPETKGVELDSDVPAGAL